MSSQLCQISMFNVQCPKAASSGAALNISISFCWWTRGENIFFNIWNSIYLLHSIFISPFGIQTWNSVFSSFFAVSNFKKKNYLLNLSFTSSVGTKLARIIMQKKTDGQRWLCSTEWQKSGSSSSTAAIVCLDTSNAKKKRNEGKKSTEELCQIHKWISEARKLFWIFETQFFFHTHTPFVASFIYKIYIDEPCGVKLHIFFFWFQHLFKFVFFLNFLPLRTIRRLGKLLFILNKFEFAL